MVALPKLLDRESELTRLETAWLEAVTGKRQLVMVWGRRRVGKTFLLSHFVQGKRSIFFAATQQAELIELRRLIEAVRRDLPEAADFSGGGFPNWEAALRFLAALAADQPLAVVLDEVPYLARSTPGFASIVQTVWDHLKPNTRLMLVLTGSAVGMIEDMLGARGSLHGRPTVRLRLDPFSATEARLFLPRMQPESFLEAYAACGGYPLHLLEWDQMTSTNANLRRLAFGPGAILAEDAMAILREELPDSGGYPRILAAIGRGRTRYSEILNEAGQRIEYPLEVLVRTGLVNKVLPIGAPKGAKATYEIVDPYLAFWFHVLYSDIALIEGGQGEAVRRRAEPRWQTHLGRVFEETSRAHATRLVARGELPSDLRIGRWWTTRGEPCEVDVLGLRGSTTYLLGEARWQKEPLGKGELESLRRKVARTPRPADDPIYALWGRTGVKEEVRRAGALGFDVAAVLA